MTDASGIINVPGVGLWPSCSTAGGDCPNGLAVGPASTCDTACQQLLATVELRQSIDNLAYRQHADMTDLWSVMSVLLAVVAIKQIVNWIAWLCTSQEWQGRFNALRNDVGRVENGVDDAASQSRRARKILRRAELRSEGARE